MPKPGLLRLSAAIFYDSTLLIGVLFFATMIALPFNEGKAFEKSAFYIVYLLVISFFYYAWSWTHGGQTLGLKTWKISLRSINNSPVSWSQACIRFGIAILSWACFGLGFLWMLIDRQKRSWHDLASNTGLYLNAGAQTHQPNN